MATIAEALVRGTLEDFELPDWEARLPIRPLHVTPELFNWAEAKPELRDETLAVGRRTLFEHLTQMFSDFGCSQRPSAGDLRRMMPTARGIWSMHPVGLRVYGWCPAPSTFGAVPAALELETKQDRRL